MHVHSKLEDQLCSKSLMVVYFKYKNNTLYYENYIERHSSSSSRVTSWSKCKNLITVTEVCTKIYLTTGTSHTHHLKIHKVKT